MTKRLHDESTKAIRLKNIQSIFGFFTEQRMNKERWETEPADLTAYTAVDVLIDYCLSRDKYCQDCVFNHEANMCELFSRIRQKTRKEMLQWRSNYDYTRRSYKGNKPNI